MSIQIVLTWPQHFTLFLGMDYCHLVSTPTVFMLYIVQIYSLCSYMMYIVQFFS